MIAHLDLNDVHLRYVIVLQNKTPHIFVQEYKEDKTLEKEETPQKE